ncbi:iron complex transport system substrate-binding protein [Mesobacillus persicus]|uniref:Iron complex transport system substrate-binding protein n=1 Tax=Mesobacillus persicus TaxID=930146 RepID=A0A1H8KKD6_9BACI|nr:iron-hydroxamate ABC transporter substrate-binding protein [Mesobacillus persicus]SEN93433.1 iron complex transport system substrate-binding protein [Mesobacillus persicus]
MKTNMKFHRLFITIVTFALVLIISACGNEDTSPETETEGEANNTEVVLDSAMGEVTLPANAEKIMAPYHEDALLALGVTPVAKWSIGQMVQDYLEADLKDVPGIEWNLPLEQVLNHTPDLIILQNNMDSYEGTYEDYNKIAATYLMTEEMVADWRKQIETFGIILGKEDEAQKVLADYEEKVSSAHDQLSETLGDETVAVIWTAGDQFYLFEQNRHSAEVLYSELGVNQPTLIEELGVAAAAWNPISVEKLSELDADHVILLALEGEQGIQTLENSSVWQSTPAAKNGNVHIINDPSNWTNKGLIASQQTIDDVLSVLGE